MGKRKTQRYWVETQAQDDSWNYCCRDKRQVYKNTIHRPLERDANAMVAFMDRVVEYAKSNGVKIKGARVMQVDPEGRENLYHAATHAAPSEDKQQP